MYFTVYQITNLLNHKIYVGVHQTPDLDDGYMGSGLLIKRAISKYGIENFVKKYIAIFDNQADMFAMETRIVNRDFIKEDTNYNIAMGGIDGSFARLNDSSPAHIERAQKAAKLGHQALMARYASDPDLRTRMSDVSRANVAKASKVSPRFLGKKHSEESKRKTSETMKGYGAGSGNSQHGTCWIKKSDELDKKIPLLLLSRYEEEGWARGRSFKPRK